MSALLANPPAMVFIMIVLVAVIPTAIIYRHKTRKAEMDADLKMKMLELGMSASEIEKVLLAESSPDDPQSASRAMQSASKEFRYNQQARS